MVTPKPTLTLARKRAAALFCGELGTMDFYYSIVIFWIFIGP
jgi:hypothetical protein